LESNGYKCDVISDSDLDSNPDILKNYKTVVIAGHSEYWSIPAYNGVKTYLSSRGRLIVLSGNTMYWRVSFSPDGTVMECRKVDGAGADTLQHNSICNCFDARRRGEAWHSDDGLRGGLMRECGFPGWQLTGLETFGILGFKSTTPPPGKPAGTPPILPSTPLARDAGDLAFGTFYVANPNHFLFQGVVNPLPNPPPPPQPFAQYTIGHECDVRVSTLEAIRLKKGFSPPDGATAPIEPGATVPGEPSKEIITLAMGSLVNPFVGVGGDVCCYPYDYFLDNIGTVDPVAEMIYWQRSDGGRVFNGGAIANGVALYYDNKNGNTDHLFAGLMKNVLTYFLGP